MALTRAYVETATGRIARLVSPEEQAGEPTRTGHVWRDWPVGLNPEGLYWPTGQANPVADPAWLEAKLIGQVKVIGERLSMRVMTAGGSKKKKYASKEREVANWYALGIVGATVNALLLAFNALPAAVKTRQFRYAQAEAAKRGGSTTVADVIARYEAGIAVSEAEAARLEAVEQDAVSRIKAASTAAAKQTAYDITAWGVSAEVMQTAMGNTGF